MRLKWWLVGSFVIAGASFASLYYILNNLWPDPQTIFAWSQILFFVTTFLGLSSATIPFAVFLNQRFANEGWLERDRTRLARQGAWVGLFGLILLYLQLYRALNWTNTLVLGGVFILIEIFFLTRD